MFEIAQFVGTKQTAEVTNGCLEHAKCNQTIVQPSLLALYDPSDSNLILVSALFTRDLVKSTVLANLTPSSKRSCDPELIQSTVRRAWILITNIESHDML